MFTQEAWAAERIEGSVALELDDAQLGRAHRPYRVEVVVTNRDGGEVTCGSLGELLRRVLAFLGVGLLVPLAADRLDDRLGDRLGELVRVLQERRVWRFDSRAVAWRRPGHFIHEDFSDVCYRAFGSNHFYRLGGTVTGAIRSVCENWARERIGEPATAGCRRESYLPDPPGWADRFPDAGVRGIRPDLTARNPSHRFGWGPVEGSLYLLDSLGWLAPSGILRPPTDVGGAPDMIVLQPADPRLAAALREATARQADVRGFVAVERTLRSLREALGDPPLDGPEFARWMDSQCGEAVRTGAIEVEAAEPRQPRHGRGLGGDRRRQLVRWQIHEPFNVLYARLRTPPGNQQDGEPST